MSEIKHEHSEEEQIPLEQPDVLDETDEEEINVKNARRDNLRSLFKEAQETDDSKKKVLVYTEWAKSQLEELLDIKDLSNIEAVHLRNTVEKLLPQFENEKELIYQGKMSALSGFEMEEEAAALWLYGVYGIRKNDIPWVYEIDDETDGKKYKYEVDDNRFDEKCDELREKGHIISYDCKVPDDFKEYLRRSRDNSHHG